MYKFIKKVISILIIIVFITGEYAWAIPSVKGENVYKLSVPTRFPAETNDFTSLVESRLKFQAGFYILNSIIPRYLATKGSSVSSSGLIEYIERALGPNKGIMNFLYRDLYKEGKSFCLPYEEKGVKLQVRYFLEKEAPRKLKTKRYQILSINGSRICYICEPYSDKKLIGAKNKNIKGSSLNGSAIAMVKKGDTWKQYEFNKDQHKVINQVWKELWEEGFRLEKSHWLVQKVKEKLKEEKITGLDINIHSPPDELIYDFIYQISDENNVPFPKRSNFKLITHPGTWSKDGTRKPVCCSLLIPASILEFLEKIHREDIYAFTDWLDHEIAHIRNKMEPQKARLSEKDISEEYPLIDFMDAFALEFLPSSKYRIIKKKDNKKSRIDTGKRGQLAIVEEKKAPEEKTVQKQSEQNEKKADLTKVINYLEGRMIKFVPGEEITYKTFINDEGEIYLKGKELPVKVVSRGNKVCEGYCNLKFVFTINAENIKMLKIYFYDETGDKFKLGNYYAPGKGNSLPESFKRREPTTTREIIARFIGTGGLEPLEEEKIISDAGIINHDGEIPFYPLKEKIKVCTVKSEYWGKKVSLRLFYDKNHGNMLESSVDGKVINYHYWNKKGELTYLRPVKGILDNIISLKAIDFKEYFAGKEIKVLDRRREIKLITPEKHKGSIRIGGSFVCICQEEAFPGRREVLLKLVERQNYGTVVEVRVKNNKGEYELTSLYYQKKTIDPETKDEKIELRHMMVGDKSSKGISSFNEFDVLRYACGDDIEIQEDAQVIFFDRSIPPEGRVRLSHYEQKKILQFCAEGDNSGKVPVARLFNDPNHGLMLETSAVCDGTGEFGNLYYRNDDGGIVTFIEKKRSDFKNSITKLDFIQYLRGKHVDVLPGREAFISDSKVDKAGNARLPVFGKIRAGEKSEQKQRELKLEFWQDPEGIHGLMVKCVVDGEVGNYYFREKNADGSITITHLKAEKFLAHNRIENLTQLDMRAYLTGKTLKNIPARAEKVSAPQKIIKMGRIKFLDLQDIKVSSDFKHNDRPEFEFVTNNTGGVVIKCILKGVGNGYIYYDKGKGAPVFVDNIEDTNGRVNGVVKAEDGKQKADTGAAIAMVKNKGIWKQYEFNSEQHKVINRAWEELWDKGYGLPQRNWLVKQVKRKLKQGGVENIDINIHAPPDALLYDLIYSLAAENGVYFPEREHFKLVTHPGTYSLNGTRQPVSCNLLIPLTGLKFLKQLQRQDGYAFTDWLEHEVAHLIDKIKREGTKRSEKDISEYYPLYDFFDAFYLEYLAPVKYKRIISQEKDMDPFGIKRQELIFKPESLDKSARTIYGKEKEDSLQGKRQEENLSKVIDYFSGKSIDFYEGEELVWSTYLNDSGEIYVKGIEQPVRVSSQRSDQCGRKTSIKFVFKETKNKEKRLCIYYYDKKSEKYERGNFYTIKEGESRPKSFRNGDGSARQMIADFFQDELKDYVEKIINEKGVEVFAQINYQGQVNFKPLATPIQIHSRNSKYHKSIVKLRLFIDPNHGYMMESSINGKVINYHFRDKTGEIVHLKPVNGIMDNIVSLTAIDVAGYFSGKQIRPLEGRTQIELETPEKQNGIIRLGGRYVHICRPDTFPGKRKIKLRLFERKNYGTIVEVQMENDQGKYETTSYQYQKKVVDVATGKEDIEIRYILVGFRDGKAIASFRELDVLRYACGDELELVEGEEEVNIGREIDNNGKIHFSHYDQKKGIQFVAGGKKGGTAPVARFFNDPNHGLILETSSIFEGKRKIGNRYYINGEGKIISLGGLGGVSRIISFTELDFVKYFQGEDIKVIEGRERFTVNGKVNKEGKVNFPIIGQLRVGEASDKKERELKFQFWEDPEGIHGLMVKCIVDGNIENYYFRDSDHKGNIKIMHFRSKAFSHLRKVQTLNELDMRAFLKGKTFDIIPERAEKISSPQKVQNIGVMNFFDIKDIAMSKKYRGNNLEMEFVYDSKRKVVIQCRLNNKNIGYIYYDRKKKMPVFIETVDEAENINKKENTTAAIAIVQENNIWHQYELTEDQHRVINTVWAKIWNDGYEVENSFVVDDLEEILEEEKLDWLDLHVHSPPEKVLYKLIYETAAKENVEFPPKEKFRLLTHPGTWSKGGTRMSTSINFLIPEEILHFLEKERDAAIDIKAYEEWVEHEVAHIIEKIKRARAQTEENPEKSVETMVTEKRRISSLLTRYLSAVYRTPKIIDPRDKNKENELKKENKAGSDKEVKKNLTEGIDLLPENGYSKVFNFLWGQKILSYDDGMNIDEIAFALGKSDMGTINSLKSLVDLNLVVEEEKKSGRKRGRWNVYYLADRVAVNCESKTLRQYIDFRLRRVYGRSHEMYDETLEEARKSIDHIFSALGKPRSNATEEMALANDHQRKGVEIQETKIVIPENNQESLEKIKVFLNSSRVEINDNEKLTAIVAGEISDMGEMQLAGVNKNIKVCSETQKQFRGLNYIKFELLNGETLARRVRISVHNEKTGHFDLTNYYLEDQETQKVYSVRNTYGFAARDLINLFLKGKPVRPLNGGISYRGENGEPLTVKSKGQIYLSKYKWLKICQAGQNEGALVELRFETDLNHGDILKCFIVDRSDKDKKVLTNCYYRDVEKKIIKHFFMGNVHKETFSMGHLDVLSFFTGENVQIITDESGENRADIVTDAVIGQDGSISLYSDYTKYHIKVCKKGKNTGEKVRLRLFEHPNYGIMLEVYVEGEKEPSNIYSWITNGNGEKILVSHLMDREGQDNLLTEAEYKGICFLSGMQVSLEKGENEFTSRSPISNKGKAYLHKVEEQPVTNKLPNGEKYSGKAVFKFKKDDIYGTMLDAFVEGRDVPDNCFFKDPLTGQIMHYRQGSAKYSLKTVQELDVSSVLRGVDFNTEQRETLLNRSKRIKLEAALWEGVLHYFGSNVNVGYKYVSKKPELELLRKSQKEIWVQFYVDGALQECIQFDKEKKEPVLVPKNFYIQIFQYMINKGFFNEENCVTSLKLKKELQIEDEILQLVVKQLEDLGIIKKITDDTGKQPDRYYLSQGSILQANQIIRRFFTGKIGQKGFVSHGVIIERLRRSIGVIMNEAKLGVIEDFLSGKNIDKNTEEIKGLKVKGQVSLSVQRGKGLRGNLSFGKDTTIPVLLPEDEEEGNKDIVLNLVKINEDRGYLFECYLKDEYDEEILISAGYRDMKTGEVKHVLDASRLKAGAFRDYMNIFAFMQTEEINAGEDKGVIADVLTPGVIGTSGRVKFSLNAVNVEIKICQAGEHKGKKARLVLLWDPVLKALRLDCFVEGDEEPSNRYFILKKGQEQSELINLRAGKGKSSRLVAKEELYAVALINGWVNELYGEEHNFNFITYGDIDKEGYIYLPFSRRNYKAAKRDMIRKGKKALLIFKEDKVYGQRIEMYAVDYLAEKDKEELTRIADRSGDPDNCYYRSMATGEITHFRAGAVSQQHSIRSIQDLDILTCLEGQKLSDEQLKCMYERSKRVSAPVKVKRNKLSLFSLGNIDFGWFPGKRPELELIKGYDDEPWVLCYVDGQLIGYIHSVGGEATEFVAKDEMVIKCLENEVGEIKKNEKEGLLAEFNVPRMKDDELDHDLSLSMGVWIMSKNEIGKRQKDVEDILFELALNISEHGGGGTIKIYGERNKYGKIKFLEIIGEDAGPGITNDLNHMTAASFIRPRNGRSRGLRSLVFKPDRLTIYTNNMKWERINPDKNAKQWFTGTFLKKNTVGTKVIIGIKLPLEKKTLTSSSFYEELLEKNGYEEFFSAKIPDKGYFTKDNNPAQILIDTVLNGNFVYEEKTMKTVLVMGTDWIWDYNNREAVQYGEINRLLVLVRKFCAANNIKFIACPDEDIPETVKDIDTKKTKVVVLAGGNTLFSEDERIEKLKRDNNVYLAGVDPQKIEEELSYHRITEMLGLLLRLAYKQNITRYNNSGILCYRDKKHSNVFIFIPLPEVDILELKEIRTRYDLMCEIIQNA